jgi:hypothetical protein
MLFLFASLVFVVLAGSPLRLAGSPPSTEGRMLTIHNNTKSYMEDYSPEKFEKVSVTTPDGSK